MSAAVAPSMPETVLSSGPSYDQTSCADNPPCIVLPAGPLYVHMSSAVRLPPAPPPVIVLPAGPEYSQISAAVKLLLLVSSLCAYVHTSAAEVMFVTSRVAYVHISLADMGLSVIVRPSAPE